jgi:GNAT superfamily N-acetyltransferase
MKVTNKFLEALTKEEREILLRDFRLPNGRGNLAPMCRTYFSNNSTKKVMAFIAKKQCPKTGEWEVLGWSVLSFADFNFTNVSGLKETFYRGRAMVFVAPDARRSKVGTVLFNAMTRMCQKAGIQTIIYSPWSYEAGSFFSNMRRKFDIDMSNVNDIWEKDRLI